MELSAEDLEDIPVVIQNDPVLECTIRFECKKSNTSEKLFHYFYLNDQQFNRKIVHPNGRAYFCCVENACKAVIITKYNSKESSTTNEEPTVLK